MKWPIFKIIMGEVKSILLVKDSFIIRCFRQKCPVAPEFCFINYVKHQWYLRQTTLRFPFHLCHWQTFIMDKAIIMLFRCFFFSQRSKNSHVKVAYRKASIIKKQNIVCQSILNFLAIASLKKHLSSSYFQSDNFIKTLFMVVKSFQHSVVAMFIISILQTNSGMQ